MVRFNLKRFNLTNNQVEDCILNAPLLEVKSDKKYIMFSYKILGDIRENLFKCYDVHSTYVELVKVLTHKLNEHIKYKNDLDVTVLELTKDNHFYGLAIEFDLEVFYLINITKVTSFVEADYKFEELDNLYPSCAFIQVNIDMNTGNSRAMWKSIKSDPVLITKNPLTSIEVTCKEVFDCYITTTSNDTYNTRFNFNNLTEKYAKKIFKILKKRREEKTNAEVKDSQPSFIRYVYHKDNYILSDVIVFYKDLEYINSEFKHLFRGIAKLKNLGTDSLKEREISKSKYSLSYKIKKLIS